MPPKKPAAGGATKKQELKKKNQTVDDKTFGLKNKKGSKQQKFIDNVSKQVMSGGNRNTWASEQEKKKASDAKKRKEAELAEMEALFGKALPVKKGAGNFANFKGVDPKEKDKKADIFADTRDNSMNNWTEEELRAAIEQKHGAENSKLKNAATTTDKICKSFIDAVENFKYGWFWSCPSGNNCKYRHCLPEGYVLKRDQKKLKEAADENKISLEDLIERERAALGVGTKITLESFNIWKKKKRSEKIKKTEKEEKKKKGKAKTGNTGGLTGRELFQYNADIGGDDDEAEDIVREKMDDDGDEGHEVNFDPNTFALPKSLLNNVPTEADTLNSDRFHVSPSNDATPVEQNGKDKVEVDEDLFGDDDIDLGDIDEQLGDLAIEEAGMS